LNVIQIKKHEVKLIPQKWN